MDIIKYDWHLTDFHPIHAQILTYGPGLYRSQPDMHSSVHLGLLLEGDHTGFNNGCRISVNEGGFYLSAPWEQHSTYGSKKGNKLLLITIDPEAVSRALLTGADKLNLLFRCQPAERQNILNQIQLNPIHAENMRRLLQMPESPERELRLWHAALGIFIDIVISDFTPKPDPDYTRLLAALKHLGRRPLSVAEGAELCRLSESRFAHLFRRVFGISFARYERLYRTRCAINEMQHCHISQKEAAERWGFYDKSHFSKICRQYLGSDEARPG